MEARKELKILAHISEAITSDLYLEDILKLIVTVVAKTLSSPICSIMLLNEKSELHIRATQSMSKIYTKKAPLKIGEGIAGLVAEENKPRQIYDVSKHKEYKYKDIAKKEHLASLLCIPLTVKKKVIGVLNCYTSAPHKFTKAEIELVTSIAHQAALVIANTNLLVRTKVIEEELEARKKIEKAKGILMKQKDIDEESAYQIMRKYSMDARKSLKEVAEAVITTYQISQKLM